MRLIFNIGEDLNHQDRVSIAVQVHDVLPPAVCFMAKDHKAIPEGESFPKTRPVCSAKTGPMSRIQNLLSLILGHLADVSDIGHECINGEMLARGFKDVNNRIQSESDVDLDMVLVFLDVVGLYPALDPEQCGELIRQTVLPSSQKTRPN